VLDAHGVLRYHGAIDDSTNEARIKRQGLREALDALLAGKPVATPEIKAFGCVIKRVRKGS
ncbi:MAG: redoxin, partial [Bryobacteraceae bacterium]